MLKIEPIKEYSKSTKYLAVASHSLTSSLLDPAIVGTTFTCSLIDNAFFNPILGITTPSAVKSGIS